MKIYKHKNYKEYYDAQIYKNKHKLKNIWVEQSEIDVVVRHIKNNITNPKFGICHGVRNGWEVEMFRNDLGIEIIGTDISPTINDFPNCIELDFHNIKDEWVDNVDFIYSNSFDHSNDPTRCLDQWMKCLKKEGVCYIHWLYAKSIDSADCFDAKVSDMKDFFSQKYNVVDEVNTIGNRIIFAIKHKTL